MYKHKSSIDQHNGSNTLSKAFNQGTISSELIEEYYVLIAGSRTITDKKWIINLINLDLDSQGIINLNESTDDILRSKYNITIVSGGATGVDFIAECYAKKYHLPFKLFPANWELNGKSAGFIRNEQMHQFISHFKNRIVLCYKDQSSTGKGTTHSISLGDKYNNTVIFNVLGDNNVLDRTIYMH